MRILWMTWKDREHPQAGGAEVVNEELAKRLVKDGHEVIFLVGRWQQSNQAQTCTTPVVRNCFQIIRVGGRFSVYWHAYRYYKKQLKDWPDLVIDEVNTIPFFAKLYVKQKNILFVHQLCREIWFYQMFFPLSLIGYLLEPLYLRILSFNFKLVPQVITVSESSKKDLLRYGFTSQNVSIIPEGIELERIPSETFNSNLASKLKAFNSQPMLLSLGSIRPMKRTLDIVKSFELLKKSVPNAKLVIAGSIEGTYAKKVIGLVRNSPHSNDIQILGAVSPQKKLELLLASHVLLAASLKEGWGLVVTEANSQGTPAVVYNVDGLRDSCKNNMTGLVCDPTPEALAEALTKLFSDHTLYEQLAKNAWEDSKQYTFEQSYAAFTKYIFGV